MHIAKLRLKAPRDTIPAARHRLENALRLSGMETRRLVLVRQLSLGKLRASQPTRTYQAKVSGRLEEQIGGAVHGASAGASSAGAVWFRSHAEAERIFLALILSGRSPKAWFWKLVIADWPQATPAVWLERQIERARRNPPMTAALAKAVLTRAQRGDLAALVRLLAGIRLPAADALPDLVVHHARAEADRSHAAGATANLSSQQIAALRRAARRVALVQPAIAQAIRIALAQHAPHAARFLARLALSAARPDRLRETSALQVQAQLLCGIAQEMDAPAATGPSAPYESASARADDKAKKASAEQRRDSAEGAQEPQRLDHADDIVASEARYEHASDRPATPVHDTEMRCHKAGLFWLIRLLDWLDFGARFQAHPLGDECQLGAELLCHIEQAFGPDREPQFRGLLDLDSLDPDLAEQLEPTLRRWARDVDKALRRIVGRRLHDLAATPGWALCDGQSLELRFLPDAADIALRRRALDIDPGWVEWLGHSVHYHFTSTALEDAL